MIVMRTNNRVANSTKPTRQLNMRVVTMTEPTKPTGTKTLPKARGTKSNPPAALAGDGGLRPTSTAEHTENVAHQDQTDNTNNDRGETNQPAAQEKGSARATLTAGAEGTENRYEGDFMLSEWISQVFHAKSELPTGTRAVLAALAVNMDDYGRAFMSVREVGIAAGIDSDKTVTKHLKLAEFNGWIIRYHDHQESSRIRYEARKVNPA